MPSSLPAQREYSIRLFGGPTLERKGLGLRISPFHGLLLSILAYHGRRGIRRGQLLSFLWPAGPESILRRRLSQVQYSLHQRLGVSDLILNVGDRFFLDVDKVEPDLEGFHTALQEHRVEEAFHLVSLGFLGEVNPFPTPEMESWVSERIRQFRADIRTATARLWGEAEQRGDWECAADMARVLLKLDPSDEASLRRLLRSLGLIGHVPQARAVFQEFSERVSSKEDDPWMPEEETRTLLGHLDTLARERGPTFMVGRFGLPDQPPLVGREDELATLGRLLRDPSDGAVLSLGLLGEPGVGKTRLAWEALRTLPFDGVRVLSARCSEFERRIPLSPFTAALKPQWVGAEARGLDDPWRAILLSVFPEWHTDPEPSPEVPQIEPSEVPRRLCEAFRQLFIALTRTDPVVLFVDDFHWADDTSLSVLDYIRHRGVEGDLRVLVALRESAGKDFPRDGVAFPSAGARWLNADRTTVRLALPRLTLEQATELAGACVKLSGQELDPNHAVRLAGRNPLLLSEVINNWALVSETEAKGLARLPASLHQVVVGPVSELNEVERRILNLLSVSIRPIAASALVAYLESFHGTSGSAALETLISRRMVELGERGFEVSSTLLAISVRGLMPAAERIGLNRSFADGLFAQKSEPALLAHYSRECQDFTSAANAFADAAKQAWDTGATLDAVHFLREALSCAHSDPEKRIAQTQLSEGLLRARMISEAIPSLRASELALAGATDFRRALLHRVFRLACEAEQKGPHAQGVLRSLWKTISEATEKGYEDVAALALDSIARYCHARSDPISLAEVVSVASSLLTPNTPVDVAVRIQLILSLRVYLGSPNEGLSAARQANALSRTASCITLRVSALNRHMMLLGTHGLLHSAEGREILAEAERLAASSGNLRERFQPRINKGVWHLLCGDFHESLETLASAAKDIARVPDADLNARLHCNMGIAHLRLGDPDSAIRHLLRAQGLVAPSVPDEGRIHILAGLGRAYLLAGRLSPASELLGDLELHLEAPFVDPILVAGFRADMESRFRRYESADEIFRVAMERTESQFPMSAVDLILQRTELLGPRLGHNGWEDKLAWAEHFCEERALHTKRRALAWGRGRVKPAC